MVVLNLYNFSAQKFLSSFHLTSKYGSVILLKTDNSWYSAYVYQTV